MQYSYRNTDRKVSIVKELSREEKRRRRRRREREAGSLGEKLFTEAPEK